MITMHWFLIGLIASIVLFSCIALWDAFRSPEIKDESDTEMHDTFLSREVALMAPIAKRPEQPVNVMALVKETTGERYVFLFDDSGRDAELLRVFGRYAANKELTFSWYDAAELSKKLRDGKESRDAT